MGGNTYSRSQGPGRAGILCKRSHGQNRRNPGCDGDPEAGQSTYINAVNVTGVSMDTGEISVEIKVEDGCYYEMLK